MSTTITETASIELEIHNHSKFPPARAISRRPTFEAIHNSAVSRTNPEECTFPIVTEATEQIFDTNAGWTVVIAGAVHFFVFLGLTYSYGIVQLHLLSENLSNVATISFIGSTSACLAPLIGLLVVKIMGRIGYRWTSIIGGTLLGLGEFTAGFATQSVPGMFLTQGVLFGIGAAFLFFPAAMLPSLWFKKKRGLATGLVYGGAGIGSAVLAISLERLIEATNLATALKIMGALAWAVCIPASFFLKAPPGYDRPATRTQWRLFRSLKFWIVMIMTAVAVFPLLVPPFLLPLYITTAGFSNQTGAAVLSAWNLASALGRIGMGFGADALMGPINSMLLSLIILGITAMALWPFAHSLGLLIFFALLNGAFSGGFFSLSPVVVGAVFGDTRLASTMSTITTSWTFGYFMGVPIASYLLEAYGGAEHGVEAFRPAFFYAGSMTLASAGMLLAVKLMMSRNILAKI